MEENRTGAEPLVPTRDLAGVPVLDVDGGDAGELFGVLTEAGSGLIRYLDLSVARSDRHVLVPVGHARVEQGATGLRARLKAVTRAELNEIPAYDSEFAALQDEFHQAVLAAFGRFLYGERYYAHPAFDHSGLYAGDHPIVRKDERSPVPAPEEGGPVWPLSHLRGFRISPDAPDIRGWDVVGAGDGRLGTVRELLVHPPSERVLYVSIDDRRVDAEGARVGEAQRILPVGYLGLNLDERRLAAPALTPGDLDALPPYHGGPLTRVEEEQVRAGLEELLSGARRYGRPDFNPPLDDIPGDRRRRSG